jgi:phage terminase large subunit
MFKALDSGYKRLVCIWHRRAGKDKSLINLLTKKACERVGNYFYLFPTYAQGRKILWEGIDKEGFKFLDHIPKELIGSVNNQEMKIELKNGSVIRVIGTDNINSIVGTNPVGCVFSEYSLQDPRAWSFIRPILAENGGWAVFNYTPRGANHGKQLYEMAAKDPANWFVQKLTVDDTGAIAKDVLDHERSEMLQQTGSDALFMQEYYVSFDAPVEGAYYGAHLLRAEEEGRITTVPYEPTVPVKTYWDLGIDDSMTIWFVQQVGREVRVIDYLEANGEGLPYYARELQKRDYLYEEHWFPHDGTVRELGTGKSRQETAESLGIKPLKIAKRPDQKEDGIEAVRNILSRCWFDSGKCELGLNALRSYQKVFDEKNNVYRTTPLHNWASHGADAFQTLALAFSDPKTRNPKPKRRYDPVTGALLS